MKRIFLEKLYLHKRECIALALMALIVRALVFHFYIQPNVYYRQPDSGDYHGAALCLRFGFGMSRPLKEKSEPIFWRTPGYPAFLAPWYYAYSPTNSSFDGAKEAQEHAIWFQILLNALLPIIMFLLALLLTQSTLIASIACLINTTVAKHLCRKSLLCNSRRYMQTLLPVHGLQLQVQPLHEMPADDVLVHQEDDANAEGSQGEEQELD